MKQSRNNRNFIKPATTVKPVNTVKPVKKPVQQPKEEPKDTTPKVRKYPKLMLALKMLFVLAVVVGVVNYTDKKGYFEPNYGFRQKKLMPAFHSLIQDDTIDVCLFGSSHIGNGINAHILSNYLGCTCFSMHQDGSDLQDVYYFMKDVLSQTRIKVAVLETFTMTNAFQMEEENIKFSRFKSLTLPTRLEAISRMFDLDDYGAAWSNTVRNHDFLFRDTVQINKNIHPAQYKPLSHIYLGSVGLQEPGINDSLIAVYDSLGPAVDGKMVKYGEYDFEYFDKIVELCKDNNVKLVLLTLPEYYRNIKNYGDWHNLINDVVGNSNCPWLDLQQRYDSTAYKREYFQKKRSTNQHIVYYGSQYFSSLLASYLKDSLKLNLPNRSNQKRWRDLFYETEGYYWNYAPRDNDTANFNVCTAKKFENIEIQNAYWCKEGNTKGFYVKFEKQSLTSEQAKKPIGLIVKGVFKGQEVNAPIKIEPMPLYPVRNYLYKVNLVNEFTPKDVLGIRFLQ